MPKYISILLPKAKQDQKKFESVFMATIHNNKSMKKVKTHGVDLDSILITIKNDKDMDNDIF